VAWDKDGEIGKKPNHEELCKAAKGMIFLKYSGKPLKNMSGVGTRSGLIVIGSLST
jgi:hypothetical protein